MHTYYGRPRPDDYYCNYCVRGKFKPGRAPGCYDAGGNTELVTNPNQIVEDESDEDESEEYQNIPSSGEVKNMLDRCLLWYEREEESTATSLLLMKRV